MMVYVLCVYTSLHNIVVSSLDSTLLTMIERRLEYLMYGDICGNSCSIPGNTNDLQLTGLTHWVNPHVDMLKTIRLVTDDLRLKGYGLRVTGFTQDPWHRSSQR